MSGTQVTKDDVRAGLAAVGLGPGDVAFVHSSLRAFGHVEGGADAVIDALLEAVGDGGTVVMPTFTWGAFHDKPVVVFDVANTPCETGLIPETFRRRPGVLRSRHVCHSVAAFGPLAADVMGDGVHPFGPGSSFDALLRLDSWNVFLGVSFGVCTALHAVEEFHQVPYRYYRDFCGSTVILPDGREEPSAAVEFLRKEEFQNHFEKMGRIFAEAGILRTARVGDAALINVRMRDIFRVASERVESDPYFLVRESGESGDTILISLR